ncbi:MAG: hypothetical protein AB7O96_13465 [Pseudobdellovibrionaceae bacterium]
MPNTIPELKNIRYLVYKYTGDSGEQGKPTLIYGFTEDGTSQLLEEGLITRQNSF